MNNALNMYKSNADPLVEELWRLSKLKNFDLIKKYLPQIEKTASKCKYQLEEIREAVLNCKLQSSHINEYRKYYEKIYNNATTSLEVKR
ncbi:hypothetical protein HZS_6807 [Henneguya salminicola]|nr:hypothetical protein HZS_6807 [Henneguya salminicola]